MCPVHVGWAWQQKREGKLADIMAAKNRELGPVNWSDDTLDGMWDDMRKTLPMPPSFEPWWASSGEQLATDMPPPPKPSTPLPRP
eukprot:5425846-Alexandrium_andersonii.AAC.1